MSMLIQFFSIFCLFFTTAAIANASHFNLKMENRSDKDTTITFTRHTGNVSLIPELQANTYLAPHTMTFSYGVEITPMSPQASFDITFKGKENCTFTVGYYGPGNPKISIAGSGCHGGGYELIEDNHTLLLYVSDIHLKKNA